MLKTLTLFIFIATLLITGCSQHVPAGINLAEDAVIQAYRAGASRTAPDDYKQAYESLDQAKVLVKSGKGNEAEAAVLDAIIKGHEAELAAYLHQLESTEQQLDSAEEYILRLEEQRNVYFEALSNIYDEQKLSEIRISGSNSYKPSSNYRVRSGENLFAIAARRKVYGDALLWPLIYKANRDQIKDPQQIYPGQVLSIPRDISEEEKTEARNTARESKIFQSPTATNGKK